MKIKPASENQSLLLDFCIQQLKTACQLAKEAGCPRLTRRIRLSLTSAGGAKRHMITRRNRMEEIT